MFTAAKSITLTTSCSFFKNTKETYSTLERATDLAGADLSVDVRLLSDAVLQVRDVGLEPVPVADDRSSFNSIAALCPLPSEGQKDNTFLVKFYLKKQTNKQKN